MIEISRTVQVNDDPDAPQLDQDQVWHGLLLKANDALPFVPQMESCHVLERGDGWLVRDILLKGVPLRERVTFEPKRRVAFERIRGVERGRIENVIETDEQGRLTLRFSFALTHEDLEEGSDGRTRALRPDAARVRERRGGHPRRRPAHRARTARGAGRRAGEHPRRHAGLDGRLLHGRRRARHGRHARPAHRRQHGLGRQQPDAARQGGDPGGHRAALGSPARDAAHVRAHVGGRRRRGRDRRRQGDLRAAERPVGHGAGDRRSSPGATGWSATCSSASTWRRCSPRSPPCPPTPPPRTERRPARDPRLQAGLRRLRDPGRRTARGVLHEGPRLRPRRRRPGGGLPHHRHRPPLRRRHPRRHPRPRGRRLRDLGGPGRGRSSGSRRRATRPSGAPTSGRARPTCSCWTSRARAPRCT